MWNDSEIQTYSSPVPHKWLPGDVVNAADGAVLERKTKRAAAIVGIVDFLSRTGYGFTARNVPLYMFHPLDPAYPPMIVASKTRPATNKIALVSFEHWESKWPRGGIQRIMGDVGNPETEKAALLLRAGAGRSLSLDPPASEGPKAPVAPTWDRVINIDPVGCIDVDDVLCWKRMDDHTTIFGIAIADASAWVPAGSELDAAAAALGQTIYVNGSVHTPMLPTSISSESASLRADGVARPVLALFFHVCDGTVASVEWKQMTVVVDTAFTYDSVYEDAVACERIREFIGALGLGLGLAEETDSHRWIEIAMLEYNRRAAETLIAAGGGLFRNHAGRPLAEWAELAESTGVRELAWFGSSSGMYETESKGHSGLNLLHYCHASSPLRRYADLVNQRALKCVLFGGEDKSEVNAALATHLNERGRALKALDRDLWFLDHFRTDTLCEAVGYIVEKREEDGTYKVYVPEWKRKVRAKAKSGDLECVGQGQRVSVCAFTDLRATSWDSRIICNISA